MDVGLSLCSNDTRRAKHLKDGILSDTEEQQLLADQPLGNNHYVFGEIPRMKP